MIAYILNEKLIIWVQISTFKIIIIVKVMKASSHKAISPSLPPASHFSEGRSPLFYIVV